MHGIAVDSPRTPGHNGGGSSSPWTRYLTPSLFTAGGNNTFSTSGLRSTSEPSTPVEAGTGTFHRKEHERNLFEESFTSSGLATHGPSKLHSTAASASDQSGLEAAVATIADSQQRSGRDPAGSSGLQHKRLSDQHGLHGNISSDEDEDDGHSISGSDKNAKRPRLGQLHSTVGNGNAPAGVETVAAVARIQDMDGRTVSFSSEQSRLSADTIFSTVAPAAAGGARNQSQSAAEDGYSSVSSAASPKTNSHNYEKSGNMGKQRGAPNGMSVDLSGISLTLPLERRHSNDSPLPLFRDPILHPTTGSVVHPHQQQQYLQQQQYQQQLQQQQAYYRSQQHEPTTPAVKSVNASAVASAAAGAAIGHSSTGGYTPFTNLPVASYPDFQDDENEYDQLAPEQEDDEDEVDEQARPSRGKPRPAPKKRGRKPKPIEEDPPSADEFDAGTDQGKSPAKLSALERNRIAASKSRKRKRERVANLEQSECGQQRRLSRVHGTNHFRLVLQPAPSSRPRTRHYSALSQTCTLKYSSCACSWRRRIPIRAHASASTSRRT